MIMAHCPKKQICVAVLCSGVHNEPMWREVCGRHSRTQSVCVGPSKYGLCPPTQRVESEVSDPLYSLLPQ
jgi:hypothetical protein